MNKFIYTVQWKEESGGKTASYRVHETKQSAENDLSTMKYKGEMEIIKWKKEIEC